MVWNAAAARRIAGRFLHGLVYLLLTAAVTSAALGIRPPLARGAAVGGLVVLAIGVAVWLAYLSFRSALKQHRAVLLQSLKYTDERQRPATHDQLSGLLCRWYFDLRLAEEIDRSVRYGLQFAVLYIALETDHYPTPAALAVDVGPRLRGAMRASDLCADLGNRNFVVIMPQTGRTRAVTAADRLTQLLAQLKPQIGVACFPEDGDKAGLLFLMAAANRSARASASAA
jgi:diguanylate cyclase (GGDEF)-like protein